MLPLIGTITSAGDVEEVMNVFFKMLVLAAIIAAVASAVFAAGCVCALFAGRGSTGALVAWLGLAGVEVLAQVIVLPHLLDHGLDPVLVTPGLALVAQVGIYLVAQALWRAGPADP